MFELPTNRRLLAARDDTAEFRKGRIRDYPVRRVYLFHAKENQPGGETDIETDK